MGFWIQTSNFMLFLINRLIKGEIEKSSGQYLGLICDESLTCRDLNSNSRHFSCFTNIFVSCGESCFLVSCVQVAGVAWCATMRIVAGVGDLVQRTRDGQAQVGYSVGGRSGGRVMPCAVCTMHVEMRSADLLVEPQNQGRRFISGLV
jgi:hypothetical protein